MSTLDALVEEARAAYKASDPLDLVVREKRLASLFTSLQKSATEIGEEHLFELGAVLKRISKRLTAMPNPAAETKRRRELRDVFERGERNVPAGVVLIVASDQYPIASWAVPLAHVFEDGNEAVLLITSKTLLASCGNVRTWVADEPLEEFPAVDAVVGPRNRLPTTVTMLPGGLGIRALETGPVPVIVDSSVLKEPLQAGKVPHEIKRIAAQIRHLRDRAYVFVSSELSDLVAPKLGHRPHHYLDKAPQETGVYTFSQLDRALEVAREVPAHATVIYADRAVVARAVAEYAARGGTTRTTHINGYPATLAIGPYYAYCGFRRKAQVTVNQRPRHWCVSLIQSLPMRSTNYVDIAMRECPQCGLACTLCSEGEESESGPEIEGEKDPR